MFTELSIKDFFCLLTDPYWLLFNNYHATSLLLSQASLAKMEWAATYSDTGLDPLTLLSTRGQ